MCCPSTPLNLAVGKHARNLIPEKRTWLRFGLRWHERLAGTLSGAQQTWHLKNKTLLKVKAICDEVCVYKRGDYRQFRLWLLKENKYARKSLRTLSKSTAVERGKVSCLEIYEKLQQRLCKDFGFTAGMLKGSTTEGRSKK